MLYTIPLKLLNFNTVMIYALPSLLITYADSSDYEWLLEHDTHLKPAQLQEVLNLQRILLAKLNEETVGWLRFGFFWDSIPFMNMLTIVTDLRGHGIGKALTIFWEREMKKAGFETVFTSSYSHEQGQFFYRKLGYKDIGGFILPDEPLELMFMKAI